MTRHARRFPPTRLGPRLRQGGLTCGGVCLACLGGSRDHWRIVPRVLTGVASTDLSVKFSLGDHHFHWPTPVAVAPIGVQGGLSTDASNGDPRTDGDLLTATAGGIPNAILCQGNVVWKRPER